MSNRDSISQLLKQLKQLHNTSEIRKLTTDQHGNLLLDEHNPADREWYENDENYDSISEK